MAIFTTKKQLIDYLNNLTGVVIGQYVGMGSFGTTGIANYWTPLLVAYGDVPALMGAEISLGSWDTVSWYTPLKSHMAGGGLVSIGWRGPNPFVSGKNMSDLYTPGNVNYTAYVKQLDKIAGWLDNLKSWAIMFRPFLEMNGINPDGKAWNWYGGYPAEQFIKLWQFTYDYLTNVKGLTNLVWVYAPNRQGEDWDSDIYPVDYYYPGAGYVDVTGISWYGDISSVADASTNGLNKLRTLGQPVIFSEFGGGSGAKEPINYDWSKVVSALNLVNVHLFMAWNEGWAVRYGTGQAALFSVGIGLSKVSVVTPPPPIPAPLPTAKISATSSRWLWWRNVTLTWATTNAVKVSIDNGVGTVANSGSKTLFTTPKTFKIMATNANGKTATAAVKVS
jgi:mannan endo-1,4-beta-mannosidase